MSTYVYLQNLPTDTGPELQLLGMFIQNMILDLIRISVTVVLLLSLQQKKLFTEALDEYLHDLVHYSTASWLAVWVSAWMRSCTVVPNKLVDETF